MKIATWYLLVFCFITIGCKRPIQTLDTSAKENLGKPDTLELPKVSRHTKNRIKLNSLIENKWANYKPDTLELKYYSMAIEIQKDLANTNNLALIGYIEDCVQMEDKTVKILIKSLELVDFQISLPENDYKKFVQKRFSFFLFLVNNIQFEFHPIKEEGRNKYCLLVNCNLIDYELVDE